jgi:hypothetical protein
MSKLIEELKKLTEDKKTVMSNIEQLEAMKITPVGPLDRNYKYFKQKRGGQFRSYKEPDAAGNNYEVYITIFEDEWKDFRTYLLASNYHRLNEINIRINEIESIDIKPRTKNPRGSFLEFFTKRIGL